MLVKYESPMLRKAVSVGRDNHWRFRPVATAEMLEAPLYIDDGFLGVPWWFVPQDQDTSLVPNTAQVRVEALREAGVNVVGTIVAHEAPKLLAAPPKPKKEIDWDKMREYGDQSVKIATALAIAAVAAASIAAIALGYLIVMAAMVDPCLIAVVETEEGCVWLEVASWYS